MEQCTLQIQPTKYGLYDAIRIKKKELILIIWSYTPSDMNVETILMPKLILTQKNSQKSDSYLKFLSFVSFNWMLIHKESVDLQAISVLYHFATAEALHTVKMFSNIITISWRVGLAEFREYYISLFYFMSLSNAYTVIIEYAWIQSAMVPCWAMSIFFRKTLILVHWLRALDSAINVIVIERVWTRAQKILLFHCFS